MSEPENVLLSVRGLTKHFTSRGVRRGRSGATAAAVVRAVDDVSFDVYRGESLALVGESGSGKSTTARLVLRLLDPTAGSVVLDGVDITRLTGGALRRRRRDVQLVFQDPLSSLSPRLTVADIVSEPLLAHGIGSGRARRERVREYLRLVGLQDDALDRYPHEFSGGQRQRIGIARALILEPQLVVCDEPVSALDVSVRSQILNLLTDLRGKLGLSLLFIAHDLAVVRQVCDRVAVMYRGRLVEVAETEVIFDRPTHPYTQALLSSIPLPNPEIQRGRKRVALARDNGSRPVTSGCRFAARCAYGVGAADERRPVLDEIEPGHLVEDCACVTSGAARSGATKPV
jgi:oligopeptide transport system ATP-binding protein